MKICWCDTETTGLTEKHGVIQIAGMIIVDRVVKERFNFRCRPIKGDLVSKEALQVNQRTLEEIKTWPDPKETFNTLISMLGKHCDKFNKNDKYVFAGHNPGFDKMMISAMADKLKFDYLFSYIDYHMLDTATVAMLCRLMGHDLPKSNKLEALCKHFGIPIDAHDAWEDICATRELLGKLLGLLCPKP